MSAPIDRIVPRLPSVPQFDSEEGSLAGWRSMLRPITTTGSPQTRKQHVVFWLIFVVLMMLSVSRSPGTPLSGSGIALRVGILLIMTAAASYLNLGVLVPRLLLGKRPFVYVLAITGTVLATGLVLGATYEQLLNVDRFPANPSSIESPADAPTEDLARRLPGEGAEGDGALPPDLLRLTSIFTVHTTVWLGAAALLHFGAGWVRNRDLEKRRLEAELMALRAQLNPHFLFNSLNNIYSLALDKSDRGPDYVLKLAELMRYILHDTQTTEVSMEQELDFVRNYFALESIRADGRMETDIRVDDGVERMRVAPLLFLPLIENAFKHGAKLKTSRAWVEFSAELQMDGALEVEVSNSKDTVGPVDVAAGFVENPGRLGLENVRRRLELLYPGSHQLEINDGPARYEVKLRIEA
ncbi:histidine kinase [Opitutaceae bacterium]|nr:histidine kinase [Opitutaceae bacterium]